MQFIFSILFEFLSFESLTRCGSSTSSFSYRDRDTFVCSCSSLPACVCYGWFNTLLTGIYFLQRNIQQTQTHTWTVGTHIIHHTRVEYIHSESTLVRRNGLFTNEMRLSYIKCVRLHTIIIIIIYTIHTRTHRSTAISVSWFGILHKQHIYAYPCWADPNIFYQIFFVLFFFNLFCCFFCFFFFFFFFFSLWKYFRSIVLWCHSSLRAGVHQSANVLVWVHYSGDFRLFFDYLAYDDGKQQQQQQQQYVPLLLFFHCEWCVFADGIFSFVLYFFLSVRSSLSWSFHSTHGYRNVVY